MPSPAQQAKAAAERTRFTAMLLEVLADPEIRRQVQAALRHTSADSGQRPGRRREYATTTAKARELKTARLASRGGVRNG